MEYEVLKPGYVFHPAFSIHTEDGVLAFAAQDVDPAWRGRPRPTGRYVSTGWIPGNLLSAGKAVVAPGMHTLYPKIPQYYEIDAVAFLVIDTSDGESARGDFPGKIPGAVRPLLKWETRFNLPSTNTSMR